MIAMDVKGITWVGNLYQKFENMCLEVEDMMYQDTVKYIENQMQAVGESVKKLYEDVMQDSLPPSSCDLDDKGASELHTDQYTDAGLCKKPIQGFKARPVKVDTKQTTKDSRIDHDVESMDIKSNLGIDENQENKKMGATKIFDEITLAETNRCRTSQSCELSNHNQNHAVSVSKPVSAEVTRLASTADCCYEIENASTEKFPNAPVLVKSSEEEQMNTKSSSGVLFGEPDGFSMDRTIYCDDSSSSMVVVSHPEQYPLKLEETCVIVTGDGLQFAPKEAGNVKTNKKKRRQAFSLSKKFARKQEYEELAEWHGNNEKVKGDCSENSDPTLLENQKKLLLPSMSEPEWELL